MVTVFWFLAPTLVAIAIALLAIPLWRRTRATAADQGIDALTVLRDQRCELDREVAAGRMTEDERESRIAELSRRVIDEELVGSPAPVVAQPKSRRGLALALAAAIPVIALPMYFLIGTPAALDPQARASAARATGHDMSSERFNVMLAELRSRLEANPGDADGWRMLAAGLQLVQDLNGSVDAYDRAVALRPDDAKLLVEYADAISQTRNRDLSGKPFELIQRALKIDPQLPKGLAMAGAAEWGRGNKLAAKEYWQRLLAVIPADSEDATSLKSMLAQIDGGAGKSTSEERGAAPPVTGTLAQSKAPATPSPAPSGTATPQGAATTTGSTASAISGTVSIAPAFARDVHPEDTLYILARPAQGPRMPLAVLRRKGSELPYAFRLDDAQAMPGGAPLSSVQQVRIEARISKSGEAISKPGDLRGESAIVAPGTANLSIIIDQIVR